MNRAIVNREILRCDLDRVRSIIDSAQGGIKPTSLKIIEDRYNNVLRQLRFLPTNFETDEIALKICEKDGVILQESFQPIRYVLYVIMYFFSLQPLIDTE